MSSIKRFSSRRVKLGKHFLADRLKNALAYDRIAGYFSSSLFEVVGEELETVAGKIRVVCNSECHPKDIETAKAAKIAIWKAWTGANPESYLDKSNNPVDYQSKMDRFQRLYNFLKSGKLEVRVLPNEAFGLIHGKAGVIILEDGSKTAFLGSANETKSAWQLNYEILWEDTSEEAATWVQEEFDNLWSHPQAVPLSEAVIIDIERLGRRKVLFDVDEWFSIEHKDIPEPAPAVIETPVYRREFGLWQHQKHFVKIAFEAHMTGVQKSRYVLADQVGLGKTIQLAMLAQLIALTGSKPILVICPKALVWQWQDEMASLLDMPSAVWDQGQWVDENGFVYPSFGQEGIKKCPRRIGIVSSGLMIHQTDASDHLLNLDYDCVILDEAHRARRKNLGPTHDNENPDPNNLLSFMLEIAPRTRSLFLATATPVQLRPVEAWDLLNILSQGDDSVLGNRFSRWRQAKIALDLVMGISNYPEDEVTQWEWICNPLPGKEEHIHFQILRRSLGIDDKTSCLAGDSFQKLREPDRARIRHAFEEMIQNHNPFIRRIVRRTRHQLETQMDPETNEPLLKPIDVILYGEGEDEALPLPIYLNDAYQISEDFCRGLGKGSGFLKTLLLRRVGSSIHAGLLTAQRMLSEWDVVSLDEDDFDQESFDQLSRTLTTDQSQLLERFIRIMEDHQDEDPKLVAVLKYLRDLNWIRDGCIIFSQYRDSIQWLIEKLTNVFPEEPIALYSGMNASGIMLNGDWTPTNRDLIKQKVQGGELRLLLGTDAASEGLNLQRLGTLINLDLPWNPTRLEQRKGRIQRIGQLHDSVRIYNMRYKDSVEDRVHQLLSSRLKDIYNLFGQIPDVLEDVWVEVAIGEKENAKRIIDAVPVEHPFEMRYTNVEPVNWESCATVLSSQEKKRVLREGWLK